MSVEKVCGRVMRIPLFDGQLPSSGPVHLVSDAGDEYLLVACDSSTPGRVEDLAAGDAPQFEPYLDQDCCVAGDILGSVIWKAKVVAGI